MLEVIVSKWKMKFELLPAVERMPMMGSARSSLRRLSDSSASSKSSSCKVLLFAEDPFAFIFGMLSYFLSNVDLIAFS